MTDIVGRSARNALGEVRQCTATNRAGERCKRFAAPGAFVCYSHGANAPQTRRAAQQRLLAMVEPAMEVITAAMQTRPPCPTCGRSDSDKDPVALRAAQIALDRAGFGPAVKVEQVREQEEEWPYFMLDEQLQQIAVWIAQADARAKGAALMQEREALSLPDITVRATKVEDAKREEE